ncbi:MAG: polyprenyl synthetase family protein [Bacteroidales bacterium]|nr:polyprenyl synthetase family protein [Candidatus Cacconaster caballi]
MLSFQEIEKIVEKSAKVVNHPSQPANLYAPIDYMLSIGGKRVRPILCLIIYNLYSNNLDRNVIFPAFALEVFHEFTLIHDDIMDKSDTRRGQPTVHKKWNDNVALLSGDVMFILSYKYLAECPSFCKSEVYDLFTKTAIEVCEGQQLDMDFENKSFITMDDYLGMISLKTAVLLACSAKMGAIMAGRPQKECNALYDYGYQLGMAFQITDDYLDTFGDEKVFGKKIGGDIANNKKTWLLVEAFKRADSAQKARLSEIMSIGLWQKETKIQQMQQLYVETGVKDAALSVIGDYYSKAMNALAPAGLNEEQTARLGFFAEKIIGREK